MKIMISHVGKPPFYYILPYARAEVNESLTDKKEIVFLMNEGRREGKCRR